MSSGLASRPRPTELVQFLDTYTEYTVTKEFHFFQVQQGQEQTAPLCHGVSLLFDRGRQRDANAWITTQVLNDRCRYVTSTKNQDLSVLKGCHNIFENCFGLPDLLPK